MSEAIQNGISRYSLYKMRDSGVLEQISRGVYRLADLPPIGNPDLIIVSLRFPKAVVCLISALSFHGITTQIPHEISVAVPRNARMPSLAYPPVHAYKFSTEAFECGIEKHQIDGVNVRIYSVEKTLADCFKYRNKLGMDVVLEALKLYRSHRKLNMDALQKYARICRVEKIMKPYLGSDSVSKLPRNIAASVRQKLKNRAAQDNRPFAELLQYYSMERFLYRLTQSKHSDRFILKGALMLRIWQSPEFSTQSRPTMDIDMLGKTSNRVDDICAQIIDIISIDTDDGLSFDPTTIKGEVIKEDADYEGVRVRFIGTLENARVNMQIDVGFGDIVHPQPVEIELPAMLDFPSPRLLCYSRESAIAEKFEAMIKLGELNSRMKDFYDIWILSRQFAFDGVELATAVRLTLENRETEIPEVITAFTEGFINAKQKQWAAFYKRLGQGHVPSDFAEIVTGVESFLRPITWALIDGTQIPKIWLASDSWK